MPSTSARPDDAATRPVRLSVVVPMFNEEAVIPILVERLRPVCDGLTGPEGATGDHPHGRTAGLTGRRGGDATAPTSYEVLAVDDGSTDLTPALLERFRREWPELRIVRLRSNAGHQAAISAGLARARGDYVVTLDADLQDPPEVITRMLDAAVTQDVDVVYGVRSDRSSDSMFKRLSARAFYRVIRRLSGTSAQDDAGDFRLMSRATVDAVTALPDHGRVLRFAVPALGFPSASVSYRREERAAGSSKYPLAKMVRLSVDSVTGFSITPLRFATWLGLGGGLAAFGLLVYALVARLLHQTLPGWTSTVVAVSAVGAVQLLGLGILGEYVGRIYVAMQARPAYFVARDSLEENADEQAFPSARGAEADHGATDPTATDPAGTGTRPPSSRRPAGSLSRAEPVSEDEPAPVGRPPAGG